MINRCTQKLIKQTIKVARAVNHLSQQYNTENIKNNEKSICNISITVMFMTRIYLI